MEMEILLYDTIVVLFLFGFIILSWKVWNWAWLKPKKLEKCLKQQGFGGNSYRLLFGDLKEASKLFQEATSKPINLSHDIVPRIMPDIHNTIKNYGKKSFLWIGRTPKVLVMDPELIRDVLANYSVFQKHFKTFNPITKFLLTGIGSYNGDKWAKHRRIISPSFHHDRLKQMLFAFRASYGEMLSKWEKACSKEGSCEVDVFPVFDTVSSDVISRTAFGSNYEEGEKIFILLKELMDLTVQTMRSVYVPGLHLLPTKRNLRLKKIESEIKKSLTVIINGRVKAIKEGEPCGNDLLGTLLDSNFKEIEKQQNKKMNVGLTLDEVISECKLFYYAGQETTGILLTWTMILLSIHPEWQVRAREEILEVLGEDEPDFDRVNSLKVVAMILYEVLRLYPPVVEVTRVVAEDTKLKEYTLPAGVQLMMPSIAIHRDTEIWGKDAMEFNPERFAGGVPKGTVSFLSFGWGPRTCLGQNFALLQARTALTMILQRFSVELSPTYTHAPFTILTNQPQYGATAIFRKI